MMAPPKNSSLFHRLIETMSMKRVFSKCMCRASARSLTTRSQFSASNFTKSASPTFASSQHRMMSAAKKEEPEALTLPEALAAELQEEAARGDEVDQEYAEARVAVLKSFKLHEELGSGVVKLSRTEGSEKTEITFNVQDEEEEFDDSQLDAEDGGDEEGLDEDAAMGSGINFEVGVAKEGYGKMVYKCVAQASGEIAVRNLQFVPPGKSADDINLYEGPRFDQLAEPLQDAVYDYLAERRVDGELGFFILAHSSAKEQKEYEHWLKRLLEFTDSK